MTDYPDDILSRHIKPDYSAFTRKRTEKTSEAAEAAYQRFIARLRETPLPDPNPAQKPSDPRSGDA